MKSRPFDRSEHVYKNDAFAELVKDAVRFFNGTPVHTLPPPEPFLGTGVYAIYYTGKNPIYKKYAELNRLSYSYPIYVGKAVPKGWRQASYPTIISINPKSYLTDCASTAGTSAQVRGWVSKILAAGLLFLKMPART
jgi:hypothetical protein